MRLPNLRPSTDQIAMINAFLGYNHNLSGEDAEWYEMTNMTNDLFPVFSQRGKRGIMRKIENFQGMAGGKNLAFVEDNELFYNDSSVAQLSPGAERTIILMGAQLCVFPDNLIYNTSSGEITQMENSVTKSGAKLTLCRLDGTPFDSIESATEPPDKTKYWIDTSNTPVVMKQYSQSLSMWASVPTTYIKIEATGIGTGFKAYDAADFTGIDTGKTYNKQDLNRSNIIYDAGDDYVIIAGLIDKTFNNSKEISIKRRVPKMDYLCELDNRIWGCSSENHEIYACKLGDPTNWYCYAGLDSDSYAVTVGTEDIFTGAIAYQGTVMFAKETGFHRLYGNKPSNFEMSWKPGRGVQKGSGKSMCIVGDVMFFKSRDAICTYDGSISVISDKLGTGSFYDAVAGAYRDKYYISMRDEGYKYHVFVYDLTKGTWVREDSKHFVQMAYTNNGLNMVDESGNLYTVNKEQMYTKLFPMSDLGEEYRYPSTTLYPGDVAAGIVEDDFEWSATSMEIGMDSPYRKYIKRLNARFTLTAGGRVRIEIMYDDNENWITVTNFQAAKKRTYDIPVPVKRCDHLRIRISGKGEFKLFSLARAIEEGSLDD